MKVLILTNNDVGLFKFRKELLEALLKKYEVYLSLPYGPYVEQMVQMGCQYIETDFDRGGKNIFADLSLLSHYKKIIKELHPSVVLTYTVKPNVYGGMAAASMGIPQIANVTGLGTVVEERGPLRYLVLGLYRLGLRKAHMIFFQNERNQNFMLDHHIVGKRNALLPGSGVNLEEHHFEPYPQESENIVFLTICRILRVKGIDELLTAAEKVRKEHPNVRFQIIGPYEDDYREKIEAAVEKEVVEYLGPQKDVKPFIQRSHCMVHPAYHEGMSNVLLESLSTGRPVIATDVPGCIETFEPGVSGFACKARDAEDLVAAIQKFIALPYEEKAAMGRAGRKRMEEIFDRRIIVRKYLEEIEKLAK